MITVYHADNLDVLRDIPDRSINLVYVDPPFNTGITQKRTSVRMNADPNGEVCGFVGKRYRVQPIKTTSYDDKFDDFIGFLEPRIREAYRILKDDGSFFFHLDYREIHYCKVMIDTIFGRTSFMNEIIWAYDYGARSKVRWPAKHDNILWYAKNPECYTFNYDEMDRIPYMAPSLVGEEKAKMGKTPTDVWWHTIVSPNGKEKTGYVTQKPLGILNRIVKIHSRPNDLLCDFFAGSGSFGEASELNGRDCILVDKNVDAINIMKERFKKFEDVEFIDNLNKE